MQILSRAPLPGREEAARWHKAGSVKRLAVLLLALAVAGCREVRVKTYAQGTTEAPGGNEIRIVQSSGELERLGIHAPIRYKHEFGIVLLMGPHHDAGWHQVIESIRANDYRVQVVAFDAGPPGGGDPTPEYRTYTLWIIPNSVYRRGSEIDVVTPSNTPVASTVLR